MTCLPVQNLDASGVLPMVLADRSGSIGTFAGSVALRIVRTPVLAIANAISNLDHRSGKAAVAIWPWPELDLRP
ncbi:MAG: hypothetical protein IPN78_09525 [Candidatus Accumulibacter sp.]|jgi:hypothetical protein|nr:hypothetical protein [Candidatus Accumulibacter propinquus]